MSPVIVYSSNSCPNCVNLKKALETKGIEYQELNISEQPEHAVELREKGFRQLPVINNDGDWMSGFTRSNFEKVVQSRAAI